jgi:hypothetical protein
MIRNILVVNGNKDEGKAWRDRLVREGLAVLPECLNLSDMVNFLMREKVHIVLLSAELADDINFSVMQAITDFFLRAKMIVVGDPDPRSAYLKFWRVNKTIASDLNAAINNYCKSTLAMPAVAKASIVKVEEQNAKILLGDNFLSSEEAAVLLGQTFKWSPGYAVIGIHVDSFYNEAYDVLKKEMASQNAAYLLQYSPNEFYAVIDKSPSLEFIMKLANGIRSKLFKETDAMFSIGISHVRDKANELYACRKEAARAFKATHMFGYNSVIHISYLGPHDIEYIYPKHKEQKLIEATLDGDVECAFKMLGDIFEVLKTSKDIKQELINKIVLGITINLNTAATMRVSAFGKMTLDSLSLSKLLSAASLDEAHEYLKKGIEDFAHEMDAITEVSRDALFYKLTAAKEAKKQLPISDLSQELGTTPAFINTAINRNCKGDVFSLLYLP